MSSELLKLQSTQGRHTEMLRHNLQHVDEDNEHLDIVDEGVIADAEGDALDRRWVPDGERVLGPHLHGVDNTMRRSLMMHDAGDAGVSSRGSGADMMVRRAPPL